jgi:two-component SAPR family response regulator
LDKLIIALKLVDGIFMPGSNLEWISVRRDELEVLIEEAEMEISVLAYKLGQFEIARQNCENLLARNPYLTVAYKILMMTEIAVDSQPSILSVYLRAKKAHENIGLEIDDELTVLMNKQKKKVRI